ncbi:TPA: HAD-IB family hydrolase [Kluyvera intermedia]|uniref:HAD family hydrolase n=1 Tax=Kluyvera intermedia TaxID=61648 RepID=A0ABX3U982_KLUIN|nr:HAD family hydrolase [Kluyvera intermedia]ORJ48086.1 HAD family hydrolase [Kluyvera intermedia]HAU8266248.1 HAD-IB family hydrolase [Kluyvera intermedia]
MSQALYVFDLDNTLIDGDSSTLFSRFLVREGYVSDPDYLQHEERLMLDYARGEMDLHEYVALIMSALVELSRDDVDQLVARCVQADIRPRIYPQALALIRALQAQHQPMLIISASVSLLVKAIAPVLGIEHAIGIEVKMDNDRYTGIIDGTPSYQEGKITCLHHWLAAQPQYAGPLTFYTDSINDLPLCLRADEVFLVNPCPQLAAQGEQRCWPVLNWRLD